MEGMLHSALITLVLSACVFVSTRRHSFLKTLVIAGMLLYPFSFLRLFNGSGLNLSMLITGLFGAPSPLSVLLALWACGAKYLRLKVLPRRSALFLSIFGGLVFLDALGLLPISLIYAPRTFVWLSLCIWGGLAFHVHKVLGSFFVLILGFNLFCPVALPYNLFMDIYLWIVALWIARPKKFL
ncbi:hypothetical protein ACFOPX_04625 [Helicobacter baculiformis]|uniref:Uncharacterized protein n=1 Tax=Helicobacter baculiformis TaxID=427351 RepID=A0ABV7ZJH7_9HELI|nr:hypothetical protein [Helicobacter baculiformis]